MERIRRVVSLRSCRPRLEANAELRKLSLFASAVERLLRSIMVPDGELLHRYVADGDDRAFTTLVERHINIVYRAALRRVGGNAHAADDVTQRVFTALARKAPALREHGSLAGWLYTSTRFAAAELVRSEQRRRKHEQEAHTMHELNALPSSPVQLDPFLDEVLEKLSPRDREAVILHFFEGLSFVEIATVVSSTADATRMRVNRSLERLRAELARRGVASTAAVLGTALAAESAIAAPASLAANVASTALQQAAISASTIAKLVSLVKTSPWIVGSAAVILVATSVIILRPLGSRSPESSANSQTANSSATLGQRSVEASERVSAAATSDSPATEASSPSLGDSTRPVSAARGSVFDALSTAEKNILAVLWRQQEELPRVAGVAWGLKGEGPRAPNHEGVDLLVERGWVAVSDAKQVVHLTPRGRAFCAAHRRELQAYRVTPVASK